MTIKNVLVPVDFSPPSRLALDYAVSLARKFRATLTLMHVMESPSGLAHSFRSESAKTENAHREQALRMLSALLGSEDQDDLDLRIVIKSGDIKDEIVSTIGEQRADIAVMGTHGRGFFGRLVIGSITEGILRRTTIPVLTVSRATKPLTFGRILFATDLSESSRCGFRFALDVAQTMGSDVLILHALERVCLTYGGGEMVGYVSEHNVEEAKKKLVDFAAEANSRQVKTETLVVEGVPAEEILKAASESDADLILITAAHKGFVERTLLGTTAERVIREAQVPVLSIPTSASMSPKQIPEMDTARETR
jgi:nucleotide-binding universal stress UspA family protein